MGNTTGDKYDVSAPDYFNFCDEAIFQIRLLRFAQMTGSPPCAIEVSIVGMTTWGIIKDF